MGKFCFFESAFLFWRRSFFEKSSILKFENVSCEVEFGEEAAVLGAWCGLGRRLGSFLIIWAAVRSCRFLAADPLALPDF